MKLVIPSVTFTVAIFAFSPLTSQPQPSLPEQFSGLLALVTAEPVEQHDETHMEAWKIEALKAAEEFVRLIDQGRYAESWTQGSTIFQNIVSQREWKLALQLARAPLGKANARTLKDERPAWDPKGLPKGPYMVVEFNTSFDRAADSGELLTLRREADGSWKVLTYQVN